MIAKVFAAAGALAYTTAAARWFTKEQVAIVAAGAIVSSLMELGKGLGFGTVLMKQLPAKGETRENSELTCAYLICSVTVPVLIALPFLLGAHHLSNYWFGNNSFQSSLEWAVSTSVLSTPVNSVALILQAQQRFARLAALQIGSAFMAKVLPCLAALWADHSFETFLTYSALGAAMSVALAIVATVGAISVRLISVSTIRSLWPASKHFYLAGYLRFAATQLDQMIVAILFPPSALAVYFLLRRFYSAGVLLIDAVADALVPELSRITARDPEAGIVLVEKWIDNGLLVAGLGGGLLVAASGFLLSALVGPGYASPPLVAMLMMSALSYFLFQMAQTCIVLGNSPSHLLSITLLAACANLAGIAVLGSWIGVAGLPLAMTISSLAAVEWAGRRGLVPVRRPQFLLASGAIGIASVSTAFLLIVVVVVSGLTLYRWSGTPPCATTIRPTN